MTLIEVVVALLITGLAVVGIVNGYNYCTHSAQRAALSLAANARAMERLEETRSAKWDTSSWPQVDLLVATNFPDKTVTLDLSGSGKATATATIQTTIAQISSSPPLKRIRVDCTWTFQGAKIVNSLETCRSPDQ